MRTSRSLAFALVLAALASTAPAQGVGSQVPELELERFGLTQAETFEDFHGRAILLEFFAFW